MFNILRPRQHGRHFADDTFKRILLNENVIISMKISLKFVPKGPISNIPALVQIMAWRRPGDKPLSEAMMLSLLMHICVTRLQWVKDIHGIALSYLLDCIVMNFDMHIHDAIWMGSMYVFSSCQQRDMQNISFICATSFGMICQTLWRTLWI